VKKTIKIPANLKDIVPIFLEKRGMEISELEDLFQDKKWDKIQKLAHQLKGNAPSYGFELLGDLGARLEVAAKNGIEKPIRELLDEYRHILDQIDIVFSDD